MNLKEKRKNANLTQKQLAQKVGYEQTIVSMWENETREPGIQTLIKLANIFNCSIDELVGREFTQKKEPAAVIEIKQEQILTEKQRELLDIIQYFSDDDINKIIGYAVGIKQSYMSSEEIIKNLLKNYK